MIIHNQLKGAEESEELEADVAKAFGRSFLVRRSAAVHGDELDVLVTSRDDLECASPIWQLPLPHLPHKAALPPTLAPYGSSHFHTCAVWQLSRRPHLPHVAADRPTLPHMAGAS